MIYISHRGNLNGINKATENNPKQIEYVLSLGLSCEIDIYYKNNKWYLGHDEPQFQVTYRWLINHSYALWVHCKNIEALSKFSLRSGKNIWNKNINYFWHENDKVTLTSKEYIWAFPTKNRIKNSIAVLLSYIILISMVVLVFVAMR